MTRAQADRRLPDLRPLAFVAALLATTTAPGTLGAQTLGGTVVEEGTDNPVVGALMVALDSTGAARGRTLTRADGTYLVRLPVAGTYTVEVQRIGIRSQTAGPVVVPPDAPAHLRVEAGQEAIELEGISVTTARRCRVGGEAGEDVARVWEEVRKALETAVVAGQESLLTYEIERFERTLQAEDLRVVDGSSTRQTLRSDRAFRSVEADVLRRDGFVRTEGEARTFYAPDAEVLVSPAFLDTHCLSLAEADDPERIAVEFEPVPGRSVPDIRGTLLVDRGSGLLQGLDFLYVRSPSPAGEGVEGGSIRFVRAPNGVIVPADWRIRMTSSVRQGGRFGNQTVDGLVLHQLHETGGRILSVTDDGGERWGMGGDATLTGHVTDAGGRPLPGARVRVEGTAYSTVTDDEGAYRLAGLAAGRYEVRAGHTVLDSLPWPDEPSASVEVGEGERQRLSADIAFPAADEVLARRCEGHTVEEGPVPPEPRVVFGVVRNAAGSPVSGAEVGVSWQSFSVRGAAVRSGDPPGTIVNERASEAVVRTEPGGRFLVCGLPEDTRLVVRAVLGDVESLEVPVDAEVRTRRVDLTLSGS